jgi:hypothetical protein
MRVRAEGESYEGERYEGEDMRERGMIPLFTLVSAFSCDVKEELLDGQDQWPETTTYYSIGSVTIPVQCSNVSGML